jgi:integrase
VTAYETGIRLGELLAIRWEQVDFDSGFTALQTGKQERRGPYRADLEAG